LCLSATTDVKAMLLMKMVSEGVLSSIRAVKHSPFERLITPPHDSLRLLRNRNRSSASSCAIPRNVEAMTAGQLDQFGDGLRDEGHGLIRAALLPLLVGLRSPNPHRSFTLSAAPHLGQKSCIQIHVIWSKNTLFENATLGRSSQLFRYKVVPLTHSFNICRFDRGRLTTHVRLWMASRESRGTRLNIFP